MPSFLTPLFERRTYLATIDFLLDLAFGVAWFTLFTVGISAGASTLITLVGLPILTATFLLARGGAWVERRRVRTFFGAEIPDPVVRRAPGGASLLHRLVAPFRDR